MSPLGRPVAPRRSPTCRRGPRTPRAIAGHWTGFSGILQVDGYAAYKRWRAIMVHDSAGFLLAHARRKFVEV